jgi:hypothetical protein
LDGRECAGASETVGGTTPHLARWGSAIVRRNGGDRSRILAGYVPRGPIAGDVVRRRRSAGPTGREWTFTPTSEICWRNSDARTLATPLSAATPSATMRSLVQRRISIFWYRLRAAISSASRALSSTSALHPMWLARPEISAKRRSSISAYLQCASTSFEARTALMMSTPLWRGRFAWKPLGLARQRGSVTYCCPSGVS